MATQEVKSIFELAPLPFDTNALEPYIDQSTMVLHHINHHQKYVEKLNKAIAGTEAENFSLDEILRNVSRFSSGIRNNAGGHFNHSFFWTILHPEGKEFPEQEAEDAIAEEFGTLENFTREFSKTAMNIFGSGWAWLVVNENGKLVIGSTPNEDNPLMNDASFRGHPILGLDMWEHAYYLQHQSYKQQYINDFWKMINWEEVAEYYRFAMDDLNAG